jgi:hypothetical protein
MAIVYAAAGIADNRAVNDTSTRIITGINARATIARNRAIGDLGKDGIWNQTVALIVCNGAVLNGETNCIKGPDTAAGIS